MEMRDMMARMAEEERARTAGVKKMETFLRRTLGERIEHPEEVTQAFVGMDYETFKDRLSQLNGILRDVPIAERGAFQDKLKVASFLDVKSLVIPPPETCDQIFETTYAQLQAIAQGDSDLKQEIIARTLFNALIYLHPMRDANGREARLLYGLTAPGIDRGPDFLEKLMKGMQQRAPQILDYHHTLNSHQYQVMLEQRGLPLDVDEESGAFIARMEHDHDFGFDVEFMTYIAAVDVMTEQEKAALAYAAPGRSERSLFNFDRFPADLQERVQAAVPAVREEFTQGILETSLSDEPYPDWLLEYLNASYREE